MRRAQVARVAKTDPALCRANLLEEALLPAFVLKGDAGKQAMGRWIS